MTLKIALLASNVSVLNPTSEYLLKTHPSLDVVLLRGEIENTEEALLEEQPDLLLLFPADDTSESRLITTLEGLSQKKLLDKIAVVYNDPSLNFMKSAMRLGLRDVLTPPTLEAELNLVIDGIKKIRNSPPPQNKEGKVYAFTSSKGGSGSTFIATNVAHTLAENTNQSVLVIDLHLQFGDAVLFLCDGGAPSTVVDTTQQIARLDASLLVASTLQLQPNLHILPASDDVEKNRAVTPEQISRLVTLARQNYDFIILDISRSLESSCLAALIQADGVFLVGQMSLPFLRGAKRQVNVIQTAGVKSSRIHLIINRFEKRSELALDDVEHAVGLKVFHTFPNRYETVEGAINRGVPVRKYAGADAISKSFGEFAQRLTQPQNALGWIKSTLMRIPFVKTEPSVTP